MRLSRWVRPRPPDDFWLACGVQGDAGELHRQGMLLMLSERGREALAVACELWRRDGLHEHHAADLLMGAYAAWVPLDERAPADAERFLRWVLDELDGSPAPPALPAEDLPSGFTAEVTARYRVQAWACGRLIALARAVGDDDRLRSAEALALAVSARMAPALAPAAARAFLAAHPGSVPAPADPLGAVAPQPVPPVTSPSRRGA